MRPRAAGFRRIEAECSARSGWNPRGPRRARLPAPPRLHQPGTVEKSALKADPRYVKVGVRNGLEPHGRNLRRCSPSPMPENEKAQVRASVVCVRGPTAPTGQCLLAAELAVDSGVLAGGWVVALADDVMSAAVAPDAAIERRQLPGRAAAVRARRIERARPTSSQQTE